MKLYIFRCRTRPKMYGATRYETASNLPTNKCSGWEFHERVDLKPGGRLRFAVDTETVRRGVEQRGWHVWDEAPWEAPQPAPKSVPPPVQEEPLPSKQAVEPKESVKPAPVQMVETKSFVSEERRPAAELKTAEPELVKEPLREEPKETGLKDSQQRSAEEIETDLLENWAGRSRKEAAAEAVTAPSRELRPLTETGAALPAVAPAPAKKTVPRIMPPPRTTPGVAPSRPAQKVQSEKVQAEKVQPEKAETPRAVSKPAARHQVVWFDIPVRDIDRAMRFYSAVLGTPLKKEQAGPGAAVAVLPHADAAIGGSLVQNMDARPSDSGPLIYLNAQGRLDQAIEAAAAHGGKVLAEKHSIAPFGFRAIVIDSEGNRIALHSD